MTSTTHKTVSSDWARIARNLNFFLLRDGNRSADVISSDDAEARHSREEPYTQYICTKHSVSTGRSI